MSPSSPNSAARSSPFSISVSSCSLAAALLRLAAFKHGLLVTTLRCLLLPPAAERTGAACEVSGARVEHDSHSAPEMADAACCCLLDMLWWCCSDQRHLGVGDGTDASTWRLKVEAAGGCHAPANKHLMIPALYVGCGAWSGREGGREKSTTGGQDARVNESKSGGTSLVLLQVLDRTRPGRSVSVWSLDCRWTLDSGLHVR